MTKYKTQIDFNRTEDVTIYRHSDGSVSANVELVGWRADKFDYGRRGNQPDELGLSILNSFVPAFADGEFAEALPDRWCLKIRHISRFVFENFRVFTDEMVNLLPQEERRHVLKGADVCQWIQERVRKEHEKEQGPESELEPEQSRGR